jgi:hypothetical protein
MVLGWFSNEEIVLGWFSNGARMVLKWFAKRKSKRSRNA